ncbi:MAG: gluconate 2-dehydrogenase subunit 3 family protein [Gammaproteobacteria bacterium]
MNEQALSRRAFLKSATENAKNSLLVLTIPSLLAAGKEAQAAMESARPFSALSAWEAREYAAIAARIIPTDETPGATEAGVIYFIDNILSSSRAEVLPTMREGLAELLTTCKTIFGSATFYTLTAEQQDSLLRGIEQTAFFNTMRYLTVAGTFASPAYGGNRDQIGWQLIGFEDRHVWQAPYGHYDAEYMATGE